MSAVPKGVIVLLVVIAMVFVVVLAMGGGQGETATPQDPPGIVDALGDLGGGRQLRIDEDGVTDTCDPRTHDSRFRVLMVVGAAVGNPKFGSCGPGVPPAAG